MHLLNVLIFLSGGGGDQGGVSEDSICQTEETKSKREREEAPHDEAAVAPEGP